MSLGPIESLRFVHNAIRAEAQQLEDAADSAESPTAAGQLLSRIEFLTTLLDRHQSGEEIGLFPALDEAVPNVADAYRFDHEAERTLCAEVVELARGCAKGDADALPRLRRRLTILRESVTNHSRKEDELILPLVAKHFDAPAQGQLVAKIISAIPQEDMPKAVPWIVERQSDDDATAYVSVLMRAMPEPAFAAAKGWIRGGVSSARWTMLTSRLPALAAE